jgi:hypothetical protein
MTCSTQVVDVFSNVSIVCSIYRRAAFVAGTDRVSLRMYACMHVRMYACMF